MFLISLLYRRNKWDITFCIISYGVKKTEEEISRKKRSTMNADRLHKSDRKRERNGQTSWNKMHECIGECCSCLSIWSGCFCEADLQGDKTEHLFELQILKCQACLYESGQDYWSQMAVWGFGPHQSFQVMRQRQRFSAGLWRNRQNWGGPLCV